jgi:hypothetical protein
LVLFNEKPEKYLAFNRKGDYEKRIWLEDMFKPGKHHVNIDMNNEVDSVRNKILGGMGGFSLNFHCDVHSFQPLAKNGTNTIFYGYFIYIYQFEFRNKNYIIEYDAFSKEKWDQERVENLKKLANLIDKNMPAEPKLDAKKNTQ